MKDVALLLKYHILIQSKEIWRLKWRFLFILLFFSLIIGLLSRNSEPLFQISYQNDDNSFMGQLILDNFIDYVSSMSQIDKKKSPEDDAFIFFPKDFAAHWQQFKHLPAEIHILSQNPIKRLLLEEIFRQYESILLASESVISVYNQELEKMDENEAMLLNTKISLDFLSLALNRQALLEEKKLSGLNPNLSSEYYFFSLGFFFMLLFSILGQTAKRPAIYKRIRISQIPFWADFLAYFLFRLCKGIFLLAFFYSIRVYLQLRPLGLEFWFWTLILYLSLQLFISCLAASLKSPNDFFWLAGSISFLMAFWGGAFLPISFFPASWQFRLSPFFLGFSLWSSWSFKNPLGMESLALVIILGLLMIFDYRLRWRRNYA